MKFLILEVLFIIFFFMISILLVQKYDRYRLKSIFRSPIKMSILLIFLIYFSTRFLCIDRLPCGLESDEVSIGYEAYSLANYGIDRNGNKLPIHLESWGSGQNALYAYILVPFIKVFGLNILSIRLPMAIIGSISIIMLYFLLKSILNFDNKKILLILFLFTVMPWHLTKSRWALESNIFPDLVFYSIVFMYGGIKNNNKRYLSISSVILGISTYSYGTSYLVIPIFLLLTYIYMVRYKYMNLLDAIKYFTITGIVAFPMILFVIINYFKLDSIRLFNIFTIPRLNYNRMEAMTILNGNILKSLSNYINAAYYIIINQQDYKPTNWVSSFGIFYKYLLPFIPIGLYFSIKNKDILNKIFNSLFIASFILLFFVQPDINRLNILWVVLIYYIIYGIYNIYLNNKEVVLILSLFCLILFNSYLIYYNKNYNDDVSIYNKNSLVEAIGFTKNLNYKKLYIYPYTENMYIYYLYSYKIPPKEFIKKQVVLEKVENYNYKNIGNVYFEIETDLDLDNVYIVNYDDFNKLDTRYFNFEFFENYVVIY